MDYRLEIWHDPDTENPADEDGALFGLVSFNTRHTSYRDPYTLEESGILFRLSYYEHGLCRWSLAGEGSSDPWDSVRYAGVLIPGRYMSLDPDHYATMSDEQKTEAARATVDEYTDWCNGSTYGYTLTLLEECNLGENHEAQLIESCGGFIGSKWLADYLRDVIELTEDDSLTLTGACADALHHEEGPWA